MKNDRKKTTSARNGTKTKPRVRATYSEAARSFSEPLDRVCYRGESFVIERGGEPVCEISHVKPMRFTGADFLTLLHSLPKPDPAFWNAVEKATRQEPAVPESPWEC